MPSYQFWLAIGYMATLNFRIAENLVRYFKRMPAHVGVSVQESWEQLLGKLKDLPGEIYKFPEMNLLSLPTNQEHPVQHSIPDQFNFVEDEVDTLPEIVGYEFPEQLFDHNIREGIDVAILTQDKDTRPWVGRVSKILPNRQFSIHWFERNGRSLKFRPMFHRDGSRYLSDIENSNVIMWDISLHKFVDSFHISSATFDKIMREYDKYD